MAVNVWGETHKYGGMSKHTWATDPKRLGIMLARYKFVAKMLAGKQNVLEIGCADGMGTHVVAQHVEKVIACDTDGAAIIEAVNSQIADNIIFFEGTAQDFSPDPINLYQATYALDVLEHVEPRNEHDFLEDMAICAPICIIGSPSLESQPYASELSRAGHVNCKTGPDFRAILERHFSQVFMFSMNDEVVHTGFEAMAHYRIGVCVR